MIPSTFGAGTSGSFIQASSFNHSHPSVSSTHKSLRFGSMHFHELGDKGIYLPPAALMEWLDKQENPSRVRTLTDLSKMTEREAYWKSPEGQESLIAALESRKRDLARSGIGPYRTDMVELLGKEHLNITDRELISNAVYDVIKNNPGTTQKARNKFISTLLMYEGDPPFASKGFRLGEEGAPPAHPPLIEAGKSKAAQETKKAWTKNLSVWKAKTRIKDRYPKRMIVGHGAGLKPLTARMTASRRCGAGIRDLPEAWSIDRLHRIHKKYPPGLMYQLGLKGARKPSFKRHQSEFTPAKWVIPEITALQEESKSAIATQTSVTPTTTSANTAPTPIASEHLTLQEITNSSNPRRSQAKTRETSHRQQSAIKHAASGAVIPETVSKENTMPSTGARSPFHVPLKPIASETPQKTSSNQGISDFRISKAGTGKSRRTQTTHRSPLLSRSISATQPGKALNGPPRLPVHKTFGGYPHFQRLESFRV